MKKILFIILFLYGCHGGKVNDPSVIIIDINKDSTSFYSNSVLIANSDKELVNFILKEGQSVVSIESRVKLTQPKVASLIKSLENAGISIKSFVVPISEPPGKIDLLSNSPNNPKQHH